MSTALSSEIALCIPFYVNPELPFCDRVITWITIVIAY